MDNDKLIWKIAILESIPLLLLTVCNLNLKTYFGVELGSRWFGIHRLIDLSLSLVILTAMSQKTVMDFIRDNLMSIAVANFIMRCVRAYCIPIYPEIAIILEAIDLALFLECIAVGVEDLLNKHFIGKDRTTFTIRKKQGRYTCIIIGSSLVVMLGSIDVYVTSMIYVFAAIISILCRLRVITILRHIGVVGK